MVERWRFHGIQFRMVALLVLCFLNHNLCLCLSLNDEGLALLRFREGVEIDPFGALSNWNDDDGLDNPCSWFGVECSDEKVVILDLRDLCLEGILAPELGNLIHIKSIILRNNSFYGVIPKEIGKLKELEVLDLGFNNFSGPLPFDNGNNLSLTILLLDNNDFLEDISPEIHELNMLSALQVDESHLNDAVQGPSCQKRLLARNMAKSGHVAERRLLLEPVVNTKNEKRQNLSSKFPPPSPEPSPNAPSPTPSSSLTPAPAPAPAPGPSPVSAPEPAPAPAPVPDLSFFPPGDPPTPVPSPSESLSQSPPASIAQHPSTAATKNSSNQRSIIIGASLGSSFFALLVVTGILVCRKNSMGTVKPWATGLSGQLQKAFVTGVPKLKRSELESACEDFSNIIDSSSNSTTYKGTLSTGVEIAVVSTAVTSSKEWSIHFEAQYRKKVDTLSKLNHKNFVNLLGYCEEEEPFTRMMVFEYAPNGTLFEHLHIKESEHLDWGARLRIGMGMAYCLDYMHQLNPPVTHKDLNSSAIYLTEDYAAKISDFVFWHEGKPKVESDSTEIQDTPSPNFENNVYNFGLILLEMITGRLRYSEENGMLEEWASIYLRGEQPYIEMVDPMLESFEEDEFEKLCSVVASCIHPDPKQRPTMREVATQLKDITGLEPDGAIPKLTPLWWAELEILSTEAC